jgi:hypothetical protein
MNPQHRYFFVHIMKTAGSVLRLRLINHLGEAAVYPTAVDGTDIVRPYLVVDHLRERLAARGDEIQVITGHFPLCATEMLEGRFTTLTLLREPVDRTLSYLRRRREIEPSDRHKTLEEVYEDPFRFQRFVHNHMTKMLSLTPAEMAPEGMLTRVEFTRDHLERAKAALAGIDAVGLQEHFEDFCAELSARFGWHLAEPETQNKSAPVEVEESLRARIAEDNAFDVELYEYAHELLASRGVVGADR